MTDSSKHLAKAPIPIAVIAALCLGTVGSVSAQDAGTKPAGHAPLNRRLYLQAVAQRETLTNRLWGFGETLEAIGITPTLDLWTVYHSNVHGGLETEDDLNGTYFLTSTFDLERLIGWEEATTFFRVEGGWHDGINEYVGALMGVNATAIGNEIAALTHLWLEQDLIDQRIRLRAGNLDVTVDGFDFHGRTVAFDAMPYANFGETQFLNAGLVNNSSVPFPSDGLGFEFLVEPLEKMYGAATIINANSGFGIDKGAFDDDAKWMYLGELGVAVDAGQEALPGQYYAGYWYSEFEDTHSGQGLYLGGAQMVFREEGTKDQGIGVFGRYGYACRPASGIQQFASLGGQIRGLFCGRDKDVLGLGWAQSFTNGSQFSEPYEGALELYYRAQVTPWFHFGPHCQYIMNPGSSKIDDAFTVAIRAQITF